MGSKVIHLDTKAYRLHSRLLAGDNETPPACQSFTEFYVAREEWSNTHP
jgi:hypothetical protein